MNPRFFSPDPLPEFGEFVLPEAAAHHAEKVLRMSVGDELVLFDGGGAEHGARLVALGKRVRVEMLGRSSPQRESPLELVLVQALAAADKMDWVIQKAVELGVARIIPLAAERCVLKLSEERAEKRQRHWLHIIVSACEQSGRNCLPTLDAVSPLPQYLERSAGIRRLLLAPGAPGRLATLGPFDGPVHLLVGPEGGWSPRELAMFSAAGCSAIGLGPRVLRTETAGLAALAALQARWGDL